MSKILSFTRWLTSVFVSLHVSALRASVGIADVKARICADDVDKAKEDVNIARQNIELAKQNVSAKKAAEAEAASKLRLTKIAAEAEIKFLGRD